MNTGKKADIILAGAAFYRGRGMDNDVDFVAVSGNRILATGRRGDMSAYMDGNTELISFDEDNLIMAGLHDNHVHIIQAGILEKYVRLYDTTSKEDAARRVGAFAKTIPDDRWVLGVGYWRMSWEDTSMPTKELLDEQVSDRPVLLLDAELHAAWLNSKALEICGIGKDTPAPDGGIIDRDETGEPRGCLLENAVPMGCRYAFDFDDGTLKDLITRYAKKAAAFGITSVSDMTPYLSMDLSYPDMYLEMAGNGELPIRVNAARNLFEDISKFKALQRRAEDEGRGMYRIPFMKQFMDGTPANYTGMLLGDYSDNPGVRGEPTIDIDALGPAVEAATANGISVRLHSCGDGSCRAALDAYENALRKHPGSGCRHMVEHLEVVSPDDIPRFGRLGVIASIQPEHLASGKMKWSENCYPERLGGERARYTWPFRSLRDAGAVLAGGSDCPVVEGNPYWGMYVGNTRLYYDGLPEGGWNPQETLTMEDLLDSYTIGAAYAEHREHELGTIEAGKLADITVVDRNLLKLSGSADIRDTKALLTMVDGKIVYRR